MRVCPRCGFETDASVCPHDGATTVSVSTAVATYANGTVIADRYRVEEVLGIGGFGAVYKCTQLAMDQEVAVKVLKSEHIQSEEHVKRFAREAQAASKLSHPNTIRIFDFGSHTDDALYLAMEFLEGETFAQRLDRDHQIPAPQVAHILTQVCHSLTEAHGAGIIHRDLKPENIMLMRVAGDSSFVKVLDFGIAAKLADANDRDEKLTEMGMIMGTPTYMSPEQAHGKPLDERSDIYALGVLMYEALTGRVPFEGDQPMTVLVKHINDPPRPPREVAPEAGISHALEKVVLRCLEKEPVLRPQSCAELAELLAKALAQPDGGLLRGRPASPGAAPAVDMLSTEPLAELPEQGADPFATQAVSTPRRPSSQGSYASPSTTSSKTPLWIGLGAFALVGAAAVALALFVPASTQTSKGKTVTAGAHSPKDATVKAGAARVEAAPAAPSAADTQVKPAGPGAAPTVQGVAGSATAPANAKAAAPRADEGHRPTTANTVKARGDAGPRASPRPKPTRPAQPKRAGTKSADPKATGAKPGSRAGAQAANTKNTDSKNADTKATGAKPAATDPAAARKPRPRPAKPKPRTPTKDDFRI